MWPAPVRAAKGLAWQAACSMARIEGEIHMARKPSPSQAHDVVTLADLAPRTRIVGGSERRVFGSDLSTDENRRHTMASKKDLPPKKSVKGGRIVL